jgi:ribosome-associated protein
MEDLQEIVIHTEFIKLQQALKLAGFLNQGSDVKFYLSQEQILVNGQVALERGKKLRNGDSVELIGSGKFKIIAEN